MLPLFSVFFFYFLTITPYHKGGGINNFMTAWAYFRKIFWWTQKYKCLKSIIWIYCDHQIKLIFHCITTVDILTFSKCRISIKHINTNWLYSCFYIGTIYLIFNAMVLTVSIIPHYLIVGTFYIYFLSYIVPWCISSLYYQSTGVYPTEICWL